MADSGNGLLGNGKRDFLIVLEQDVSGAWVSTCSGVNGVVGKGETKDDAVISITRSLEILFEYRRKTQGVNLDIYPVQDADLRKITRAVDCHRLIYSQSQATIL